MSLDSLRGCALEATAKQLTRRHFGQIVCRPTEVHRDMQQAYCLTYRPGDRSGTFNGKLLRAVGTASLIVLSYEDIDELHRKRLALRGYRAQVEMDGSVSYGVHEEKLFHYEGAAPLRKNGRGRNLDPFRNPSLAVTVGLDRETSRRYAKPNLPQMTLFPRIMLGFAPGQLPLFEDSPALRRRAAKRIGISVDRLGANGDVLLEQLLRDVWEAEILQPGQGRNDTGLSLIDADLCTYARTSLRAFEDYSELVGTHTWNPARETTPVTASNPAAIVLGEFGVDATQDFCQHIPPEIVDGTLARMKELTGAASTQFTDEEIMDGITSPNEPLTAWTAALPQLRAKLSPAIAEGVTDEDLLRATRDLDGPLYASGLCRIQVLRRRPIGKPWGLFFSSDDLGRRVSAGLAAQDSTVPADLVTANGETTVPA